MSSLDETRVDARQAHHAAPACRSDALLVYVNTSQGDGDLRGPWNSDENFQYVSDREQMLAMDGGDGKPSVRLDERQAERIEAMAERQASMRDSNPTTGAELGDENF